MGNRNSILNLNPEVYAQLTPAQLAALKGDTQELINLSNSGQSLDGSLVMAMAAHNEETTNFLLNSMQSGPRDYEVDEGALLTDSDCGYSNARSDDSTDELDNTEYDDIDVADICANAPAVAVSSRPSSHPKMIGFNNLVLPHHENSRGAKYHTGTSPVSQSPSNINNSSSPNSKTNLSSSPSSKANLSSSPSSKNKLSSSPSSIPTNGTDRPSYPSLNDVDQTQATNSTSPQNQASNWSYWLSWIPGLSKNTTNNPSNPKDLNDNKANKPQDGESQDANQSISAANSSPQKSNSPRSSQQQEIEETIHKDYEALSPQLKDLIQRMVKAEIKHIVDETVAQVVVRSPPGELASSPPKATSPINHYSPPVDSASLPPPPPPPPSMNGAPPPPPPPSAIPGSSAAASAPAAKSESARRKWLTEVKTHINVAGRVKKESEEKVLATWAKIYDTKPQIAVLMTNDYCKLLQQMPYKVITAVEIVEWWENNLFGLLPEKFNWKEEAVKNERARRSFDIITTEFRHVQEKKTAEEIMAHRNEYVKSAFEVFETRLKKEKQEEARQANANNYNLVTEELTEKLKTVQKQLDQDQAPSEEDEDVLEEFD